MRERIFSVKVVNTNLQCSHRLRPQVGLNLTGNIRGRNSGNFGRVQGDERVEFRFVLDILSTILVDSRFFFIGDVVLMRFDVLQLG